MQMMIWQVSQLNTTMLNTTEAGDVRCFHRGLGRSTKQRCGVHDLKQRHERRHARCRHSHVSRLPTGIHLQTITVTGADDTLIDGDVPYVVQVAVDTVNTPDATSLRFLHKM
jgi:hypothetical protein